MATPRGSLNDRVLWLQVLDALELPAVSQAIPATTKCPFCKQSQLLILQDTLAGGQWHSCLNCGQSGDMIELASKTWQLSVPATIEKLSGLGVSIQFDQASLVGYFEDHLKYRKRFRDLWKAARDGYLAESTTAQSVARKYHLDSQAPPDRWMAGPGQIVGAMNYKRVHQCYSPNVRLGSGRSGTTAIMFKGGSRLKWDDVLLLPMYDLPGRICALLAVGRQGRFPEDFVLRRLNLDSSATRSRVVDSQCGGKAHWSLEGGISMHPNIFNTAAEWGRKIVAVPDPLLAAQLQARHCDNSLRQLPLVSWYPAQGDEIHRTTHSWRMFSGYQMVLWTPKLDTQTIRQAVLTGALVSTIGPRDPEGSAWTYSLNRVPEELMADIMKSAVPWPVAVAKRLGDLSDVGVEDLMRQLKLDGINISRITEACPIRTGVRINEVLSTKTIGRTVEVNGKTVIEREDAWHIEGSGVGKFEMILSGQLRIEHFVHQERAGKTFYQGHIMCEGKKVEFCAPKIQFDQNPLKYLQNLLLSERLILNGNPSWNRHFLNIAQLLHPPTFVTARERVGWDEDSLSFMFPQFSIGLGGTLSGHDSRLFPDSAPARQVAPPKTVSAQDLDVLFFEDDNTTANLWAVLVSIIANITAPAFNRQTCGIGLVGPGLEELALRIAALCGLTEYPIGTTVYTLDALLAAEHAQGWPAMALTPRRYNRQLANWVDPIRAWGGCHNALAALDWFQGTVKKILPGWHIIENSGIINSSFDPAVRIALSKFIPTYLMDLCKRRLQIDEHVDWFDQVLNDIAKFISRNHGPGGRVSSAYSVITPDRDKGDHQAFAALTHHLVRLGIFSVAPKGFSRNIRVILKLADHRLGVPKQVLETALTIKHAPMLDLARVTAVLSRAGVLLEDTEEHWIISEKWWKKEVKNIEATGSDMLRVIG